MMEKLRLTVAVPRISIHFLYITNAIAKLQFHSASVHDLCIFEYKSKEIKTSYLNRKRGKTALNESIFIHQSALFSLSKSYRSKPILLQCKIETIAIRSLFTLSLDFHARRSKAGFVVIILYWRGPHSTFT